MTLSLSVPSVWATRLDYHSSASFIKCSGGSSVLCTDVCLDLLTGLALIPQDADGLCPLSRRCRPYEDCCGSRCCVRALSIQRLWYFWFLLMMGVLFCCGAGFFIRRRMQPPPLIEEPAFNVSYTRQPPDPAPEADSRLEKWCPVRPQMQDAACAWPAASGLGWGQGAEPPVRSSC
eukprot:bmy_20374T0